MAGLGSYVEFGTPFEAMINRSLIISSTFPLFFLSLQIWKNETAIFFGGGEIWLRGGAIQ